MLLCLLARDVNSIAIWVDYRHYGHDLILARTASLCPTAVFTDVRMQVNGAKWRELSQLSSAALGPTECINDPLLPGDAEDPLGCRVQES